MQLHAGRPADEWRGVAALDTTNSGELATGYDSTGYFGVWRHQHRSDNDRDAYAEHIGMCRGHDDESGYPRDDGTGECHRRRGNPRRVLPTWLLMRERRDTPSARCQIPLGPK
jgi:hypothetical protein